MANDINSNLLPHVIRLKDAPGYLGMGRNRFNKEVRSGLIEVPIGTQGIGFNRLGLDAWFDAYKNCNRRRPRNSEGESSWAIKSRQASASGARSSIFQGLRPNHALWIDLPDWAAPEIRTRIKYAEMTLPAQNTAKQGQLDLFEDWAA